MPTTRPFAPAIALLATVAAGLLPAADARACGCFTMNSPATPVVQAGERILFAHEQDHVIAYIQIQYQGAASEFGWLVPLPSVPTLELGSQELFTMLDATTLPQYLLTRTQDYCGGGSTSYSDSNGGGCGFGDGASVADQSVSISDLGLAAAVDQGRSGVAVEQASLGPYDYAVLKADDETAMLTWLSDNHYFVPANTMDAVKPYIHAGGYFLALKLRGGESTGDITPIVLEYQSDLPMIPITLTQVGAVENMGVLVWVLGESRAIPRNYYDVVLDDVPIWLTNFGNYNTQLIDAVHEAPGKHGFITQYAGTSTLVGGKLDYSGRFGDANILRNQPTPSAYLDYLKGTGFTFDGTLLSILLRYIPEPASLIAAGVSPGQFYAQYDYYANMIVPATDPDGGVIAFAPAALTDEIEQRIVTPDKNANALIGRHPYLTRMYTALSPIDMTIDPVFSFNPDLPNVQLAHAATVTTPCVGQDWMSTDQGFEAYFNSSPSLPASLLVQKLLDVGPPQVVQDNTATIRKTLGVVSHGQAYGSDPPQPQMSSGGCGCVVGGGRGRSNVAVLLVLAGALLMRRRLRRRA